MKKILIRITLFFFSFFVIGFFLYSLFYPIYVADSIIFTFAITPFDIAKVYPKIWDFIKKTYFLLMFISYFIILNYLYSTFQKYFQLKSYSKNLQKTQTSNSTIDELKLLIGKNQNGENVFLKEAGLYQNMLITGTIGSRKNFFSNVPFYKTINLL